MSSKPPLPSVKNFIIADQVFRQESGKWCIIGIFGKIVCHRLPTLHSSLGLYLTVADAEGEYDVRVELEDAEGRCLARMTNVKLKMPHRQAEFGFGIQTRQLPLYKAGVHHFRVYFNNEIAAQDVPLHVLLAEGVSRADGT